MKPDSAMEILDRLRSKGYEAYLVGGCVRDLVMNIEPSDYDIATSAPPADIVRMFPHTETIGAQFGVVLVVHRGHPFEVATFRSDEAYVDGRHPTGVVFTDAQTDVLRRDFTINGLLYDPTTKRVIDYVAGEQDIRDRVIRAIGDPRKRFAEDKLRLLRAVRFAARFGYSIEPQTWDAVRLMSRQIGQVSVERIQKELLRILTEGHADRGVRLLHESGLLAEILPELTWTEHLELSLHRIKFGAPVDFALAVLLHELSFEMARSVAERLKMSRAEIQHVLTLVKNQSRFDTIQTDSISALKRFLRLSRFEDHLELARICAVASDRDLADYDFAVKLRSKWSAEDIAPPLLISGDDLIAMGFTPGPHFKEILTRLEDEQLEGRLKSREEAAQFVKGEYLGAGGSR